MAASITDILNLHHVLKSLKHFYLSSLFEKNICTKIYSLQSNIFQDIFVDHIASPLTKYHTYNQQLRNIHFYIQKNMILIRMIQNKGLVSNVMNFPCTHQCNEIQKQYIINLYK